MSLLPSPSSGQCFPPFVYDTQDIAMWREQSPILAIDTGVQGFGAILSMLIVYSILQVEAFLKAMHRQLQSGGKRSFFGKRAVAPQGRDKYTVEDMLCFQRVQRVFTILMNSCCYFVVPFA